MASFRSLIVACGSTSFLLGSALIASDIFPHFHRSNSSCSGGSCETPHEVVRLPAQDIRIETSRPRIIVNEVSGHRSRGGSLFGAAPPMMFAQPLFAQPMMMAQPMTASFFTAAPMTNFGNVAGFGGGLNFAVQDSSSAPRSHALSTMLELQHLSLELAKEKAAKDVETNYLNNMQKQLQSQILQTMGGGVSSNGVSSSGSASSCDLNKVMQDLSNLDKRVGDLERLLLEQGKVLKTLVKPEGN